MDTDEKRSIEPGSVVRIKRGPYKGCVATVERIDPGKGQMRVLISFFGRSIHADVEFREIDRR